MSTDCMDKSAEIGGNPWLDFVEGMDRLEAFGKMLRGVAGAEGEEGFHARFTCGFEFTDNVRDEEHLAGRQLQLCCDTAIALRISLLPDIRIKVIVDVLREIAGLGVREE